MTKKILVIDDEELITKSLTKLLEKEGFEVYTAKRGEDAITLCEEENFDLIIADIRMPGINGIDTIEHIYNKLKKIPTIFITGYADEKYEERAHKLSPIAFIYKPFDIKDFVEKIKEVLK